MIGSRHPIAPARAPSPVDYVTFSVGAAAARAFCVRAGAAWANIVDATAARTFVVGADVARAFHVAVTTENAGESLELNNLEVLDPQCLFFHFFAPF
jgi:hypothetical protein